MFESAMMETESDVTHRKQGKELVVKTTRTSFLEGIESVMRISRLVGLVHKCGMHLQIDIRDECLCENLPFFRLSQKRYLK
ncbi:hypothetical protein J6590_101624 [Homalodisca vitripennis]|nr:hypothetical protein J6590_101624 [Homalodisca vitripennis]